VSSTQYGTVRDATLVLLRELGMTTIFGKLFTAYACQLIVED
jgi:hypothetical protein